MGDSLAVELAQQSHCEVLKQLGGCMLESEVVAFRRPHPRGAFSEYLCIDDHVGVQVITAQAARARARARDTVVFEQSQRAYREVELNPHPTKRQRAVTSGTFLGADLDGVKGLVSAPRDRTLVLMLCSVEVARRGVVSPRLLSMLVGSWIHVLMFRRAGLCILDAVFKDSLALPADGLIKLSRKARNELVAVALVAPAFATDLRAAWCEKLFCMDASPSGAALCQVDVPACAISEFWRFCEQRGYHTKLEPPSTAALRELGLESSLVYGEDPPSTLDGSFPLRPSLVEGFLYDCCEICRGSGSWSEAHAALGLRVHDGVDVSGPRFRFLDLSSDAVFHELRALALRRAVRDWRAGPPCASFGTLRRPRLRSKLQPAGFDPSDPLTSLHTRLARRVAFLMCIVARSGCFFSVEQPASSVMFRLQCFVRLKCLGASVVRFCYCSFGAAFRKASAWMTNKPWMMRISPGCHCPAGHKHFVVQGRFSHDSIRHFDSLCKPSAVAVFGRLPRVGESVAEFSAAYPLPLVRSLAAGSLEASKGSAKVVPFTSVASECPSLREIVALVQNDEACAPVAREAHDDPEWIGELSDSLGFEEALRYRFRKTGHINMLEARMFKTFQKYAASRHQDARLVSLLDSRVTMGAVAKGRSSSPGLCRILQGTLPYTLGAGLYNGSLHVYSASNRSDGPSRNRPVAGPSKKLPLWFEDLCAGKPFRFDCVVASSRAPKLAARWLRLLLLLGGDIEPNPGPSDVRPLVPRGPLDLKSGFTAATSARMAQCLAAFQEWVLQEFSLPFSRLCLAPENQLSAAWQIDRKWQHQEPGECRPVISVPIVQAMTAIALTWNWRRFAGVFLIGFLCMLHPAEYITLTRGDLIFPSDVLSSDRICYVHIRNPKTARFARRQHARLEDNSVLTLLETLFENLPFSARLFPGSAFSFRSQWNAILRQLGIPYLKVHKGVTPGVLRGSGATHLYLETEDLTKVAWRGRWSKQKTLEFYLQEVAAQAILQRLPVASRNKISALCALAPKLVALASESPAAKHFRDG
ncbi:hypothetical protein AK812_SmicGene42515 [Symbiodinium microadriaticum]|uniref:Uncharacterized protein n=1 Tax=Symbiodinium microadriaticum TaxID=2951 RepID=A0A1Q9C3D1_SYMMI|nr:hypothetical protein AK812_SmicGene42515 [Symbiodinium microadriaticum]